MKIPATLQPESVLGTERPTLKTIARLAGLAVPTVSRALNDAPDIGGDTKLRVREIARQIGYRPNRAGVRLRTGRTSVISLVLPTEPDIMNHTARLIASLAEGLRGTPYHMIVTPFSQHEDPMTPIRYIVETASADGIVMNQTKPDDPRIAYLIERNFPFATHGRTGWNHPFADFDNTRFGEIAVEMLAGRGRRRLLLLRPPFGQTYSIHLDQGVAAAAARLGCTVVVPQHITSDTPGTEIEREMRPYLQGPDACDGFVIPSANAARAMIAAAEDLGLVIGRDFDVAAKEAMPFLRRFRREILTVFEDVSMAGTFIARALIHRIGHPDDPPLQLLDRPEGPCG
jgi:LacI family transcriptional regulator